MWNNFPLDYLDKSIFWTGIIAIAITIGESIVFLFQMRPGLLTFLIAFCYIVIIFSAILGWICYWLLYGKKYIALASLKADENEAEQWVSYKKDAISSKDQATQNQTMQDE